MSPITAPSSLAQPRLPSVTLANGWRLAVENFFCRCGTIIRCIDAEPIDGGFRITCRDCGIDLLTYEKAK